MKKIITALLIILSAGAASMAHEFWIQPANFFYHVGETLSATLNIGQNFIGEPWQSAKDKIEKLDIHHLGSVTDLKSLVKADPKENLAYALKEEGTHMVVFQSKNSFVEQEAEKFNEYLKEDGLDDPLYQREKSNTLTKPGRENYSYYSKMLIQVGGKRDDTYKKVVGLPLEIVPIQNPYVLKVGDQMKFKILYNGKPLFGAKVMFWNRKNNRTAIQPVYTQQDGTVEEHISDNGIWMITVVKMIPSKDPSADWQSYWGSLTFGVH